MLPMLPRGHRLRCRCELLTDAQDHCHQHADGEDMLCQWCRVGCAAVHPPGMFTLNIDAADPCTELRSPPCPQAVLTPVRTAVHD